MASNIYYDNNVLNDSSFNATPVSWANEQNMLTLHTKLLWKLLGNGDNYVSNI